jgi:hypothetical protein
VWQNARKQQHLFLINFPDKLHSIKWKRRKPLRQEDGAVAKEMKQKGQKGNPLNQPLSLHYFTSLTLRIMGEKVI